MLVEHNEVVEDPHDRPFGDERRFLVDSAWNKGDFVTAHAAARDCAPYIHPRLHSVEDERRERARQAILEAFAERPLIEGTVIKDDPELNDAELNSDEG
jgi:hypothetical protein